jgi:hypothetical protein
MHHAALANDPAYMEVLLAYGADPNLPNTVTGHTPLMSALMGSRDSQFSALLAGGANPNLADHFGNTSLHQAAKINDFRHVLDLLEAGADPAARNRRGGTFQAYLYGTPERILSADGRRGREAIAEGLGVPAISNRTEGDPVPTLEASAKGMLLAVGGSSLDVSKTLAGKAIARLP